MRNILVFFLISITLSGCKSSFKAGFRDFNAYYNTYYNAKKSYKLGLDKSLNQTRKYNTLLPIRIYETPLGAGAAEFENAIEKGANVLRKYKDSKWVDNALEIIGKSYFYRKEYFAAIQKFEELYITSSDEMLRQRSVFWKGRVLLELQAYNEGIQYLSEQLTIFDGEWKDNLEYQVKAVLAEHYIANENWVNALDLLNESVPKLPGRANKERGFFLIGQVNEILGNPEEAFNAYNQVEKYYTVYDLQFEAKKKKAEVARSIGRTDEAYKVFSSMVRDDKNTEFIAELNYELGKTEQERGNYENAYHIYTSILRDPYNKPDNVTKALVYNGLAEINRFAFHNFQAAAAYYDSSASINVPKEQLPESYKAPELAESFGQYAQIKREVHERDSLLWLASLSKEELDSVLVEMEQQILAEMEQQRKEEEARKNTMINVSQTTSTGIDDTQQNGFLNLDNPVALAQAQEQFRAIWGDRPLVDNWRVAQLMQNQIKLQEEEILTNSGSINGKQEESQVFIDLSRIPSDPAQQASMREEMAHLYYELGNLFFLNLDLPDSARFYFNKVLEERPESEVAAVSMYSLSELYDIRKQPELAIQTAKQLLDKFPGTVYASRLAQKYNLEQELTERAQFFTPLQAYREINLDETMGLSQKADTLAKLAMRYPNEPFSDQAMYNSIRNYIQIASQQPEFSQKLEVWKRVHDEWENTQAEFTAMKDSLTLALRDTTLTSSDSVYIQTQLDSTLTEPDFTSYFPYYGAYWDSTRARIVDFKQRFATSKFLPIVTIWEQEFALPTPKETVESDSAQAFLPSEPDGDASYLSCTSINKVPVIRGEMAGFNRRLELPEGVEETSITFLFYINTRGVIDHFEVVSDTQNEALITAYSNAISSLTFEPVMVNGVAQKVSCEVEFRIPQK